MLGLKANMKIFWISLRPGEVSLVPAPDQKGEGGWTKKLCGIMADQSVDGINWLMQEKKKDQSLEKRGIIG